MRKVLSSGVWDNLILATVFLIFLGIFLPQTKDYPYYNDDFYVLQRAQEIASDPFAAWLPEARSGRRQPIFSYFLFLESLFFGFNAGGYFLTLFLIHFLNSIFLTRLARLLGGGGLAPLLAGLLFLCSSTFYQNLIFIGGIVRVLCLFLFLLGILSWIQFLRSQRPFLLLQTIFFQIGSLLTMEDGLLFPFLAAFLTFQLIADKNERNKVLFKSCSLLFLVDFLMLIPLVEGLKDTPLGLQKITAAPSLIPKLVSLVEMLLRPLLVPERGFFPFFGSYENWIRLGPLFFSLLFLFFFFSEIDKAKFFIRGISWREFLTGAGWIGISIIPFFFQRLTFEHAGRYLYLPMVGFSLLFGMVTARLIETVRNYRSRKGLIFCFSLIAYLVTLNLQSTIYHYQRYVQYVNQHKKEHYYDRVKSLFE